MSDEDEFMLSADEDDFDFGYDGDNGGSDGVDGTSDSNMDVDDTPETQYYNAKAMRDDDPNTSMEQFWQIIEVNKDPEFTLKALKQTLKLLAAGNKGRDIQSVLYRFIDQLLVKSGGISFAYKEKSLSNIFERLSQGEQVPIADLHKNTLKQLYGEHGQERLYNRSALLCFRYALDCGDLQTATNVLDTVSSVGDSPPHDDDPFSASLYLEVIASKMELTLKSGKPLDERLYHNIAQIRSQLAHPRLLGVIKEYGGILSSQRDKWTEARAEFLSSFSHYDEAGVSDRVRVLKYHAVTATLTRSGINPFDSPETLAYRQDPALRVVGQLVDAFVATDYSRFCAIVEREHKELAQDKLVYSLLPAMGRELQGEALIKATRPYVKVTYEYLATSLGFNIAEIPGMLTGLILDGRLGQARLDALEHIVHLGQPAFKYRPALGSDSQRTSRGIINVELPERFVAQEISNEQQRRNQELLKPVATDDISEIDIGTLNNRILGAEAMFLKTTASRTRYE